MKPTPNTDLDQDLDQNLDRVLTATLRPQPRPTPSPFAVARIVHQARSRSSSRALTAYWLVLGIATVFWFGGELSPAAQGALLAVLAPVGFGVGYWRWGRE